LEYLENILNLANHINYFFNYKIIQMAKSSKKAPKKATKKAVKKAPVISPKKAAKKVVKKAAKKTAKKVVKKAVKIAPRKPAPKPVQRSGKRFLIIYHAPMDAMAQTANNTPEQHEAGMAMWNAWAERVGSRLIDLGAPLGGSKSLTAEGSLMPSTKDVAGYSFLEAEDWEELMDLLTGHPHLSGWHPEATIEVHETMLMPEM
jgi:hypothetical protein